MGRYDDIPPEQLRADLVRFARLLLRLEEEGRLLRAIPHIQSMLGELRQKLFAHEVRGTRNLPSPPRPRPSGAQPHAPPDASPEEEATLRESLRIVREALQREEEARREWTDPRVDSEDDEDS